MLYSYVTPKELPFFLSITKVFHFKAFALTQLGSILCCGCWARSRSSLKPFLGPQPKTLGPHPKTLLWSPSQWRLCGTFSSSLNEAMRIEGKQKSMDLAKIRTWDAEPSEDRHRFPCPRVNLRPWVCTFLYVMFCWGMSKVGQDCMGRLGPFKPPLLELCLPFSCLFQHISPQIQQIT